MATIDTLTGITEVAHKLYEVTSVVDIGSGIDDVTDSTFIMKDGGLLRWTNGCSTTFTRCNFVETSTCQHLGFDNFNDTSDDFINDQGRPRFFSSIANDFTVRPVFEGCVWQCYLGKRSDWDIMYAGSQFKASPTFRKDQYGNYCKVTIERDPDYPNFAQFNHFASDDITIDGLIVDHKIAPSGAFEFARIPNDTDQMKDLIILDNHEGDPARHTVLLGYNVPNGTSKTLKGLGARNIALFGGGFDYTLRVVDPVGLLRKASDATSSNDGRLQGFRTFSGTFLNATTQAIADNIRASYYTRTDVTDKKLDSKGVSNFSVELQAYEETWDSNVLDTSMNDYTEKFCGYGYLAQTNDITVSTDTTDTSFYDKGNVLLFEDLAVSDTEENVSAYSDISTSQQIYDAFHYLSVDRDDSVAYLGTSAAVKSGLELDFGSYDVVIDPTLDLPYAVFNNPTGQTHPAGASGTYTVNLSYSNSANVTVEKEVTVAELNASGPEGTGTTDWRLADIQFKPDGTKMYLSVFRTSTDGANRYLQWTLSTPWDVSTATYDGAGLAGNQNGQENSFQFNPDGTRIYRFSRWSNFYQADLTTAWDVTSLTNNSWTIISQPNDRMASAEITPDGLSCYVLRDSRSFWQNRIYKHTLSTAWDLTTMNQDWQATEYDLTVANGWDASADNSIYKNQMQFIDGGNRLMLHNGATNLLFFFELPAPYDLTGVTMPDATSSILGSVSDESNAPKFVDGARKLFYLEPRLINGDDRLEIRSQPMFLAQSYAGAANTAYIKAANIVADSFNVMRTTGYITLQNGAGTDMQLIDANGVLTSVTISGLKDPDTEVRMYRVSDDTEVAGVENAGGTQVSLNYRFTTPEDYYIVVHSVGFTTSPRYIPFTTQSAPANIPVFQQVDRSYDNPL